MWIRDIEFPASLVEAHRSGHLVLFVGAGASRDLPSNLPDFRTLAGDIARDAHLEAAERDLERPDVLLGRIEDRGVDVHHQVKMRINAPSSEPNQLHNAIVSLAAAGPTMRIVTTNYDLHLSTAMTAQGVQAMEYAAPALPMGDDFTGLVYLHGSLRQEARHLVVTEGDFGRAYLRDAWAARFLERMFTAYAVLFVGYSHDDIVMRYLARALGPLTTRFVLTSKPDAPDWEQLGVRPVGYPVIGESHSALVEAVQGWASSASMGLLAHRQRVAKLVSAPPSQVPEEASYLEEVLTDPTRVRFFTEFARGEEWLLWAATHPEFRQLFAPAGTIADCTPVLADWFTERFVMAEDLSDVALQVLHDSGGRPALTLWSSIGLHLHVRQQQQQHEPRPTWLGPWLVLLIQNAPDDLRPHRWLEYALVASTWPQDRAIALLLFDHLTEPQAVFQPWFGMAGAAKFEVRVRGDDHWLRRAWEQVFTPNLAEAAPAVLGVVDRHLSRAYALLVAADSAGPGWDPVSFGRSAVEPHPQDRIPDSVDVLIDAARDCLEKLLEDSPDLGVAYLNKWADSQAPLLRRLAVHGMVQRTDLDDTAKLVWLRERGWMFDHQLRHEAFRLIAHALPGAALEVADALVGEANAGPQEVEGESHAYERFNALVWITRHALDLQSAQEALARVRSEHPEFQERPFPDLSSWSEVGTVVPKPPMTAAELHNLLATDAAGAIHELRIYEDKTSPFDGSTWDDALAVLYETVQGWPADGFAILDADGGEHRDIVKSVVNGWAAATVDAATAEAILDRLRHVDLAPVADDVARLLSAGGQSDANPTEWHRLPDSRRLATDLWRVLESAPVELGVEDWLGRAINRSAGRLALFWVHAIAADWRTAGDTWAGLASETRTQLEELLDGDDDRTALVEVVFASQALFLFGADRAWWETHVSALLDWRNPTRALRTWDGYLVWGRWNDQMLRAGLLDNYRAAASHMAEFRGELRRQLSSHLANIAVSSELSPFDWLPAFTVEVELDDRLEWMNQVAWMLRQMPAQAVEHEWHRWMRQYWQSRLHSSPVQLTDEEASAMTAWIMRLTTSFEEGVELATAHSAGLHQQADILHDLDEGWLATSPAAFAKLLAHLLRGTQQQFWGCHNLAVIVPRLREQADPADFTVIVNEALRLGCADAPIW